MESIINATPALLDSTVIDVPWRALGSKSQSKLRIGVLQEDPLYPVHPPIKRTLAEAAKKLEAAGHELVPLTPKDGRVSDAVEVAFEMFLLHIGTSLGYINASGEPMVPSVAKQDKPANYGNYAFVPSLKDLDFVHKYASLNDLRLELSEHWRKIRLEKKLDGVLAPSAQNTAVAHDTVSHIAPQTSKLLRRMPRLACPPTPTPAARHRVLTKSSLVWMAALCKFEVLPPRTARRPWLYRIVSSSQP